MVSLGKDPNPAQTHQPKPISVVQTHHPKADLGSANLTTTFPTNKPKPVLCFNRKPKEKREHREKRVESGEHGEEKRRKREKIIASEKKGKK